MPNQLNYKHLRYFFAIAREGSIVNAAKVLNVSPQTISGQLTAFEDYLGVELFDRVGKRLVLNDSGKLAINYAEDIFALGEELQQSLNQHDFSRQFVFTVGVTDVLPKIFASSVLQHGLNIDGPVRLVVREGGFDALLSELALNRLDLILSDRPLTPGTPIKAYSHLLGESGLTFYAKKDQAAILRKGFPDSLDGAQFLTVGDRSNQKVHLQAWFEQQGVTPTVVAEFDDSALMKYFGQSGLGVFATPTVIEQHVVRQYDVAVVGRAADVTERFYAISPERKVKHPGVKLVAEAAKTFLSGSPQA